VKQVCQFELNSPTHGGGRPTKLPDVQAAVELAAAVLQICGWRLQGQQQADSATASISSLQQVAAADAASPSGGESDVEGSRDTSSSSSSSSNASSSKSSGNDSINSSDHSSSRSTQAWVTNSRDCMSRSLLAARYGAVKLANFLALVLSFRFTPALKTDPTARRLLLCDDLLLLLVSSIALVAYAYHKQAKGLSPVPPPADNWNSSSSSKTADGGVLNRQQRRLQQRDQQRQQQRQMLRVPPFHQALLVSVGIAAADVEDADIGSMPWRVPNTDVADTARGAIKATDQVLRMRSQLLIKQDAAAAAALPFTARQAYLVGCHPPHLYATFMLLTME
jgi:hypothetical protein